MREILVINPSKRRKAKRRKRTTKLRKKVKTMPKKRRSVKRRRRSNPAPRRSTRRRSVRSMGSKLLGGLNFRAAIGSMPATQLGMFAAKCAAKRFGEDASETDPGTWNWASYVKGSLGAVGAALLLKQFKPGMAQKALEGGLNLMMYKALENEVIAKNEWAVAQFGAGDEYTPDEYLLTGDQKWFLGQDGNYYPAQEQHRLPEAAYGDPLEPVTRLGSYGDSLEPVSHLGEDEDPFARAWFTPI